VNGRFNRSAFDIAKRRNPTPVNIRAAIPEDIPHIIEIERSSHTAAHWSEEQYRLAIDSARDGLERMVLVAEIDGSLIAEFKVKTPDASREKREGRDILAGFLAARHVEGEWELENIVVGPELRGRGIGTQLIEALLEHMRATNAGAVFLEVRESNTAARKLYQKAEFRETGRRKLYYSDPAEDAILYSREA
jgi:[ribosomal protein S18]-alanine N-acetyltransferase